MLLRGRKRFRLYPPSAARHMYTVGRVQRVHPNGRIVFEGQGDVAADGSDAAEAAHWLARHGAEAELAAAEAAAAEGLPVRAAGRVAGCWESGPGAGWSWGCRYTWCCLPAQHRLRSHSHLRAGPAPTLCCLTSLPPGNPPTGVRGPPSA